MPDEKTTTAITPWASVTAISLAAITAGSMYREPCRCECSKAPACECKTELKPKPEPIAPTIAKPEKTVGKGFTIEGDTR